MLVIVILTPSTLIPLSTDKKKDYKQCKILANKISNVKDLPNECFEYKDIVASFQRKPTKSDTAIAFEGMGAGKASQNYAQIQRRYTNSHRQFTKEKK